MAYPRFNRSRQFKQVSRNAGSMTVSTVANVWEELAAESGGPGTGGFDLTLKEVQPGDVLEAGFSTFLGNQAGAMMLDVRTMVSGTPVSSLSNISLNSLGSPWYATASQLIHLGAPIFYTVGAPDLLNNTCTLRPYVLGQTTTARTVYADATYRFQFWVRNNGPAQA